MFDVTKLVNGDILYYIGTGETATFIEVFVDTDSVWRGKVRDEDGRIKRYHISHFTDPHRRIFTQDKSEINNKHWLEIKNRQADTMCATTGCTNRIQNSRYCRCCVKDRKKHFKLSYYKKMGWDTSKLEGKE